MAAFIVADGLVTFIHTSASEEEIRFHVLHYMPNDEEIA
jgi:hypothetical protein